ncbi:hypothetical protein FHX82_001884 [Amycolatopsis bartoniae]|uniref:Uncharacterized protein n=1 Tax=Amycolatopsis bartoniae TaxID=941986 RepID=A0A8H9IT54_9PSEU|nr:hypothetical protein [Amycolatopsis bartoniae]MBB2934864.1 hypothetical protein [Amycolatopsis bartoniae]TVT00750.1 hypothetical protein FNH07_30965 [Amycolatopsis bartoniae]GHF44237.1 hypothetical protein GCM10017566_16390 [Amycolatopsis bartoniae]
MNDEVSVAELLEREGWGEPPSKPNGRMRVVAVMLAVVLGCGIAALLVHFGSQSTQADGTLFQLPHGPTGGLAGGGVPAEPPSGTETTAGNTTVVVTNVSEVQGTGSDGIPWHHWTPITEGASVVTTTDQPQPGQSQQDPGAPSLTTTPTTTSPAGGPSSSAPHSTTSTPPKTSQSCILGVLICW